MHFLFFSRLLYKKSGIKLKNDIRMKNLLLFLLLMGLSLTACQKEDLDPNDELAANELQGIVAVQGITTYQYGTHTFSTAENFYALRSETVVLDAYVGENIIIVFEKIEGYPVDGGPEYLNVLKVK